MNKSCCRWGKFDVLLVGIGLLPVLIGIYLYDRLPDRMASHFNLAGEVDGYQGKLSLVIFFGLLTVAMPILMKIMRFIDPKRANYDKFDSAFEIIRFVFTLFMSTIFTLLLFQNIGYVVNIQMFVLISIGVLFVVLGNYMGQFRYNYTMGFRVPWTLASEDVWRKVHRMAGPLWMLSGLLAIIGAFLPGTAAGWVFGLGIAISVILPIVYSYILYRRL